GDGQLDRGFGQLEPATSLQDRRQEVPDSVALGSVCGGLAIVISLMVWGRSRTRPGGSKTHLHMPGYFAFCRAIFCRFSLAQPSLIVCRERSEEHTSELQSR